MGLINGMKMVDGVTNMFWEKINGVQLLILTISD